MGADYGRRFVFSPHVLPPKQKLLKKQSAIEADIRGREPRVQKAFATANDMIAANVRKPSFTDCMEDP